LNPFYQKSKFSQWIITLIFVIILIGLFIVYGMILDINILLGLLFLFLLIPIFQFCGSPLFTLTGMYHYLSPMLLVFGASDEKYDLHNGTSFDYLMVMRKYKAGTEVRTAILMDYLEGLLEIISRVEKGVLPETVSVEGTSYFFSESTAKRLGFEVEQGEGFLKYNLYLNFIDLCWTYSLSQGKFAFPDLKDIKKASTTGKKLVENKDRLIKLYEYLKKKVDKY